MINWVELSHGSGRVVTWVGSSCHMGRDDLTPKRDTL